MIDNDRVAEQVKIALATFKTEEDHGSLIVSAISNRLRDVDDFVALVGATYRQIFEAGVNPTNVALTICLGIMLAQGGAGFDSRKPDDGFPVLPPGTLVQ